MKKQTKRNEFTITLPVGPVPVAQFVAIGPFCWGKGTTQQEAIRQCLRFGGKLKPTDLNVYALSAADVATVTDWGTLQWPAGTVVMQVQTAVGQVKS